MRVELGRHAREEAEGSTIPDARLKGFPWNRKEFLLCAVITALAGVLFSAPGNSLERFGFDWFSIFMRPAVVDDVVIVDMDSRSYEKLAGTNSVWPRGRHAELLRVLQKAGARAVAFDSYFDEDSSDPQQDADLSKAIAEFTATGRQVFVAAYLQQRGRFAIWDPKTARQLTNVLTDERLGYAELEPSKDEQWSDWIRKHVEPRSRTSLAWLAAAAASAPVTTNGTVRPNFQCLIHYYGGDGTLTNISYLTALDIGSLPTGFFRDKVVFVGDRRTTAETGAKKEQFGTPFKRLDGRDTWGVEIHATVCANLLHNQWIRGLNNLEHWCVTLLAALVFAGGCTLATPLTRKLRFVVIAALAVTVLATLAFWAGSLWIDWLPLVAVQLPATAAASTVCYLVRNDKEVPAGPVSLWPPRDLELIKVIGSGAFGKVWLACNKVTKVCVALKKVERGAFPAQDPFMRELRGVSNFHRICCDHPNWVCVLHVVADENLGFFYYTMDLADDVLTGQNIEPERYTPKTLKSLIGHSWLPVDQCVEIGIALSDAVHALHRAGYVHRDIKPSNIVFIRNRPCLADIGLVVRLDETISFLCTPDYMAPEAQSSPLADIYALGKVLYEAATGSHPSNFPAFPTAFPSRADRRELHQFMTLINKACENDPKDRYQSCDQLRDDLIDLRNALGNLRGAVGLHTPPTDLELPPEARP